MPKKVINSFNAGELSPYLYAREDIDKYTSGCQEIENFVPLPYGGVVRRPAIDYIANTAYDSKSRLIPFTFNVSESFMIEFGYSNESDSGVIRFFKDDKQVFAPSETINDGTYLWTRQNFQNNKYWFVTNQDGTRPPFVFATNENAGEGALPATLNVDGEIINKLENIGSVPSFFFGNGSNSGQDLGFYTVYLKLSDQPNGINPNDYDGDVKIGSSPYEVAHPYEEDELKDLKFTQSGDTLVVVHPNHPPKALVRLSAEVDTNWEFGNFEFNTGYPPLAEFNKNPDIRISTSEKSGSTTLTSNLDYFTEEHENTYIRIQQLRDLSQQSITANYATSTVSPSINVSNTNWKVETSGVWIGKVTIQKSSNDIDFEDYVVVGDTTGTGSEADANKNAKNFITNSEEPEESNTFIRLKYDHKHSDENNPFNFSLVCESQFIESLVFITEFINSTTVNGQIISNFQDTINDYNPYVEGTEYRRKDKIVTSAGIDAIHFNSNNVSFDVSLQSNLQVSPSVTDAELLNYDARLSDGLVGCASGIDNRTFNITSASYTHSPHEITFVTDTDHRLAVGMKFNCRGIIYLAEGSLDIDNDLPDPNIEHTITQIISETSFKVAVDGQHFPNNGNYDLTSVEPCRLVDCNVIFFVARYDERKKAQYSKIFISDDNETVTLLAVANHGDYPTGKGNNESTTNNNIYNGIVDIAYNNSGNNNFIIAMARDVENRDYGTLKQIFILMMLLIFRLYQQRKFQIHLITKLPLTVLIYFQELLVLVMVSIIGRHKFIKDGQQAVIGMYKQEID